jgi:hypothetical protein
MISQGIYRVLVKEKIMAKTYTLTEVSELLVVDPKSLREWIKREEWDLNDKGIDRKGIDHPNGMGQTSKYDKRILWLTEEQVSLLAKAHDRLWPPRPKSQAQAEAQATGIVGAVSLLREQVNGLREDHIGTAQFSHTVEAITERLEALERGYMSQLNQMTEVLLALKEIRDAQAAPRTRKVSQAQTSSLDQPAGEMITARQFVEAHGFTKDWLATWVENGEFQVTLVPRGQGHVKMLTAEQQAAVIAFWERTGVAYQK